uniref:methyltransferase domain-containing protein n=1 Tax=Parerythrobacter lutipelagi TaxID=1964208 RepID=UPI0010F85EBB|nr:methyltransferase domain-containing protein [Parerythrobacter lutipelagi]
MAERTIPTIFSPARRGSVAARAAKLSYEAFLIDHMAAEIIDRLKFVRHRPSRALLLGNASPTLADHLQHSGCEAIPDPGIDEEKPYHASLVDAGFDLICSLNSLDTLNDLPGALIHMHSALAPRGFAVATFVGAPSLPELRQAMLAADGDRPAARMHPSVDVRAAAELIQRAGWHSPVVDSHTLRVSYTSLDRLVSDLRLNGMTSRLASIAPPLTRHGLDQARAAFLHRAGEDGRVVETFEILTLSGWRKRPIS